MLTIKEFGLCGVDSGSLLSKKMPSDFRNRNHGTAVEVYNSERHFFQESISCLREFAYGNVDDTRRNFRVQDKYQMLWNSWAMVDTEPEGHDVLLQATNRSTTNSQDTRCSGRQKTHRYSD